MNKLELEMMLKGVIDDSYGEGKDRTQRYVAKFFAPGHDDIDLPVTQEQYAAMLNQPPMLSKWRVGLVIGTRSEIATSSRTGRQYSRDVVSVKWGTPQLIGSLLDDIQPKRAG